MNVSVVSTKVVSDYFTNRLITKIELKVSSLSPTSIIYPKTHRIWGYENGSDTGGFTLEGFSIKDNFGNPMKLTSVSPRYVGLSNERGLRYGEDNVFTIRTAENPLDAASHLELKISAGVLGNNKQIVFTIPTSSIIKIERGGM